MKDDAAEALTSSEQAQVRFVRMYGMDEAWMRPVCTTRAVLDAS